MSTPTFLKNFGSATLDMGIWRRLEDEFLTLALELQQNIKWQRLIKELGSADPSYAGELGSGNDGE